MFALPTSLEALDLIAPDPTAANPFAKISKERNQSVGGIAISVCNSKEESQDKCHLDTSSHSSVDLTQIPPLQEPSSDTESAAGERDTRVHDDTPQTTPSHWNNTLQSYYTGIAISPKSLKKMQRPQSPGALFNKYLRKSPSKDSGTGTESSVSALTVESPTGDFGKLSPLRQRNLSCTSNSSTTSSTSSSFDPIQSQPQRKSSFASGSLRFLKVIRRPKLANLVDRTQSLGRYSKNKTKSTGLDTIHSNVNEPTTMTTTDVKPSSASTSSTSSFKSLKTLRDSFRSVKKLLPSSKSKGTTDKVDHAFPTSHFEKGNNAYSYSAPSTLKANKKFQNLDKKGKRFKSLSTSNLSCYRTEELSDQIKYLDKELFKEPQKKKTNVKVSPDREKVVKKKHSFLKNVTKKIRIKSKGGIVVQEALDLDKKTESNNSKKPDSVSLISQTPSQEILKLENEPRLRTPKTSRQRLDIQEKDKAKESCEMEVPLKPEELLQQKEKSLENESNKSSTDAKKSQTFSSGNSESLDTLSKVTEKKAFNGKDKQFQITQVNDVKTKEICSEPEQESSTFESQDVKEKVVEIDGEMKKKMSWSEVVGSSSVTNKDNGTLLETRLDQDEEDGESLEKTNNIYKLTTDFNQDIECPKVSKAWEALSAELQLSDAEQQQTHYTAAEVTNHNPGITNYASIGKGGDIIDIETDETESQCARESLEDIEFTKAEDEEPSCTESFKQLNPFDFNLAHVEKGKRERLYKVLVVGELGSGKTSIIKRYVHQFFSQHYRATIGVDFALKVLRWDGDTVVRLQLWDIAGQERFGSMTRVYYKEAVGAFVVFDVTRSATLEAVPKWKADLDSKVALPDGRSIPTVLLANKSDQPKEGIAANREKMNEFSQQQGFSAWFETSAKDNINIDEAANFLVSKILEMDRWSQEPLAAPDPDKVDLSANGKHKLNSSNNCAC